MTTVAIQGDVFLIDGEVANQGRTIRGVDVSGLLMNSRMINGIFDDLNAESREQWAYPDTGTWDAERNVTEFIEAMPAWRAAGLDAFTVGIQGGSPQGYSKEQPWDSSGFTPEGHLREAFADRLSRIISEADRLGLVVIVDLFYFGQEARLDGDDAVRRATREAVQFILDGGWRNVIVEIANECNLHRLYAKNTILRSDRIHELIELAQSIDADGRRLLVSSSFAAYDPIVTPEVLQCADWILLHGNGERFHGRLGDMVQQVREHPQYEPKPIMFNEDDHFDFADESNHLMDAIRAKASWGYFDPGSVTTSPPQPTYGNYVDGYQAVPINWGINTDLKKSFFEVLTQH